MDSVSPTSSVSPLPSAPESVSRGTSAVDKDQFLNLLVTQLKNQNPLEPVTNEQFLGQVAQFQSLEAQQSTNKNLDTLINLQAASATISHLTQASALLGKQIDYEDPISGESKSGKVTSVGLKDGAVVANVGENAIPILLITGVHPESN